MNKLNNTSTRAIVIACLSWVFCQTGYTAFKEISSAGNVAQASHDAQQLSRISIESSDLNIKAPQKSSDLWQKISESTKYNSIGNVEQSTNQISRNIEMQSMEEELAIIKIEMAQIKSDLQTLQIQTLPGDKFLVKN